MVCCGTCNLDLERGGLVVALDKDTIVRCTLELEWCGKCRAYHLYLFMDKKIKAKSLADLLSRVQARCPDSASYMRVALALSAARCLSEQASSWKSASSALKVTLGVPASCKGKTKKKPYAHEPISTGICFDGSRCFMAVKGHCLEYDSDASSIPPSVSFRVINTLKRTHVRMSSLEDCAMPRMTDGASTSASTPESVSDHVFRAKLGRLADPAQLAVDALRYSTS